MVAGCGHPVFASGCRLSGFDKPQSRKKQSNTLSGGLYNMTTQKKSTSHLFGSNAPFIEEQYENYLADPSSVSESWREYFDNLQAQAGAAVRDVAHGPVIAAFAEMAKRGPVRT